MRPLGAIISILRHFMNARLERMRERYDSIRKLDLDHYVPVEESAYLISIYEGMPNM